MSFHSKHQRLRSLGLLLVLVAWAGVLSDSVLSAERSVDFNRDIRPILSDKCFQCHGPDVKNQESDLRFDSEESAKEDLGGYFAVVPNKPHESDLIARIVTKDEEERMPPIDSGKELTEEQVELLRRWIAEGAKWAPHWAYVTPARRTIPTPSATSEPIHWIDHFIQARLNDEGLQLSSPADRVTLIRRLTFDLTGLPPTPEEVDAFVQDPSKDAYEKVVDRLLASPHFGERMAAWWLDLVRYADTVGYHGDQEHHAWPYRSYVISAFNENMPFDQFTREQLAGDLLDTPEQSQLVATGYNRLLQTSHEGGLQLKEYRVMYLADRVRNFSQVWMGATVGCAQCHDHKYDPYTMKDFYSMAAFFADIDDEDHLRRQGTIPGSPTDRTPEMKVYTDEHLEVLAKIEPKIAPSDPELKKFQGEINARNNTIGGLDRHIAHLKNQIQAKKTQLEKAKEEADAKQREAEEARSPNDGKEKGDAKGVSKKDPSSQSVETKKQGGEAKKQNEKKQKAVNTPTQPEGASTKSDEKTEEKESPAKPPVKPLVNAAQKKLQEEIKALTKQEKDAQEKRAKEIPLRDAAQEKYNKVAEPIADLLKQRKEIRDASPLTMYTRPLKEPRAVRILARGNWMDETGPIVQSALPHFLSSKQSEKTKPVSTAPEPRRTRLDLANWLVTPQAEGGTGELTARVQANRFWYLMMGSGIARVLDDFGGQGDPPVHPELLDQLAVEFIESGWDVKQIMKQIAMSKTYRQSSISSAELRQLDPDNRLYARQSAWRIPAESIRDNALSISGLLVRDIGGRSVKPYQPVGYYQHLNFPSRKYVQDTDQHQWRRGLYIHWQRQFLHPMLKAFDATSREECTAKRPVSNTPTAALALLNDPTFVEAARVFAKRIIEEGGADDDARLGWAFQVATSRRPTAEELGVLQELVAKHRDYFKQHPDQAKKLLETGLSKPEMAENAEEAAAWTSIARAILNLNEVITRN